MADNNTYTLGYTGEEVEKALDFVYTQIAEPYDSSKTYVMGNHVVYDGLLYGCLDTTTGTFDTTKWQVEKIFDNDGFIIIQ